MQPNRQEQLDFITHKIARTGGGTGPGETGYYLPVMIGDVFSYIETLDGMFELGRRTYKLGCTIGGIYDKWKIKREPLSAQDDDCISYIYKLISHE